MSQLAELDSSLEDAKQMKIPPLVRALFSSAWGPVRGFEAVGRSVGRLESGGLTGRWYVLCLGRDDWRFFACSKQDLFAMSESMTLVRWLYLVLKVTLLPGLRSASRNTNGPDN